jgi:hypothetical protein
MIRWRWVHAGEESRAILDGVSGSLTEVVLKVNLNFLDESNMLMATSTMGLSKDFVVNRKGGPGYDKTLEMAQRE